MPYDEARGILYRFETGYNCANLSSAVIKIMKADGSVDTQLTTASGAITLYDEENGIFQWITSTSTNELEDYVGTNTLQAILTFTSGEVYISSTGTLTVSKVLIPTPAATGNVTQANIRINAIDGAAFIDFSSGTTLTDYEDYYLIVSDSDGTPIKGWIKNPGVSETLGTEIASGTLTPGQLYKITATEVNHFGTGLIVDSYFTACDDETCSANNKVKPVTTPAATGVTIVTEKYGTTYNWASIPTLMYDFNFKDISGGYTYAIYKRAPG